MLNFFKPKPDPVPEPEKSYYIDKHGRACENCYYFAYDENGYRCVRAQSCIQEATPYGFCPLFQAFGQPTEEQIIKGYLERCMAQTIEGDYHGKIPD